MITDDFLLLANAQASVRAAATYVSTNVIDLGVARDIGSGEEMFFYINADVAFAGGTSVEFQVISSAAADMSSPTVLGSTGAILEASLIVGYSRRLALPVSVGVGQRYLAIQAVGVGTHTAGSFSARLLLDAVSAKVYPLGYSMQ